jgi:hypothetical protein
VVSQTIPLQGTIERRLLINYRVDADTARRLVPSGLRPQLVNGYAVAGVCMIRLGSLRPPGFPAKLGWRGENAAHRVAVEWDDDSETRSGVYIPERHSASRVPVAVGGRFFPGVHRHARFDVQETHSSCRIEMSSPATRVSADVEDTEGWSSQLFPTLADASDFFRSGSIGWSPSRNGLALEGLQLNTSGWRANAATARHVASSFFDALPTGAATLDNVLVMRSIPVTWSAPTSSRPVAELTH